MTSDHRPLGSAQRTDCDITPTTAKGQSRCEKDDAIRTNQDQVSVIETMNVCTQSQSVADNVIDHPDVPDSNPTECL